MSKFIDKLRQASPVGLQPMGFRTAQPSSTKPRLLLVASLAQVGAEPLADYMAGADAGLIAVPKSSSGAKTLKEVCQAMPDIPWGGWLKDTGQGEISGVAEAGCDFVVFPAADTSLAVLQDEKLGKILEVEPSLDAGLLRAADDLPVDAVLVGGELGKDHFLTWHHLMLFRRFAELLTKPLLASVPPGVAARELQALWGAGVNGVVVAAGGEKPQGSLAELRQVIDNLTFPSTARRRKVEPLLPHMGGEGETVSEEEEI